MKKLALAILSAFLFASALTFLTSSAQKPNDNKTLATGSPRGGNPPETASTIQGDLRTIVSSGQETAGNGEAQPQLAKGTLSSGVPALSASQVETRERELQEDFETVPIRQDPMDALPAPANPTTEPASDQPSPSTNKSGVEPQAANDLVFPTVTDLTSSAAPNRSVIDEPSVGNMGNTVFYSGNWYAAVSNNGGQSFSYVNPFNTFPSINGGFCCDQVVNYAPNQNMMLWALQYSKDSSSGTLRIARAVGSTAVANNTWTYYDFNPQKFGFATGNWLDFPNLTIGGTYLYATSNVFTTSGDNFTGSVVWRIPLSELAAGGTIHFEYLTRTDVGSLRCTEGAGTTMYCGAIVSTSQVRIYRWDDASTTVFNDTVSVNSFINLNREGVATSPDGTNWAARAESRIMGAWVSGGVIGLMWAAKQGGSFPYPYTIIARFNQSTRAVISQNQLWSTQTAWLYPTASVNAAGNLAGLAAYGGGSYYPGANVWISDDVQNGFNPLALYSATSSTNGPSSNTWGDYQTVRVHKDSPNTWVASTHYLSNGGAPSNVVPRYLWFGRQRDVSTAGGARITSPANGGTFASATVTFNWSPSTGASPYYLYVGNAARSYDIYSNYVSGGSTTVSGLPTDGRLLYVTMWSTIGGVWQSVEYTYRACNGCDPIAKITSPANGTTFTSGTVTFNWSPSTGASSYYLYIGNGFRTYDIYSNYVSGGSTVVSGLPVDGRTLNVTMWSMIGGVWQPVDYTYRACATCVTTAKITSPVNGATFTSSTVTFNWSPSTGASSYYLYIGNGFRTYDIYSNYVSGGSTVVSGLPVDGRTLNVTMWSMIGGVWQPVDYTYRACATCVTTAKITSPVNGTTFGSGTVTFNWSPSTGASSYYLYIGNGFRTYDIYSNYVSGGATTVTGLPTDGRLLFVSMWSLIGGVWQPVDYSFRAFTGVTTAKIISPANGSTFTSGTVTFNWSPSTGASSYYLYIGNNFQTYDLYSNYVSGGSTTLSGFPRDGRLLYVTMWSLINGVWQPVNYTYRACNGCVIGATDGDTIAALLGMPSASLNRMDWNVNAIARPWVRRPA